MPNHEPCGLDAPAPRHVNIRSEAVLRSGLGRRLVATSLVWGGLACLGSGLAATGHAAPPTAPLVTASARQGLSVDDLLQLKALGFTDEQLVAELQRGGTVLRPSEADLERLRMAGVGPALLAALRPEPPADAPDEPDGSTLDKEGVLALVAGGASVSETLAAMRASRTVFSLTAPEALELIRKGTPRVIVVALKGLPLEVASVQSLVGEALDEPAWSALLALLGARAGELAASDALAFVRAGVPNAVVAALRSGAEPAARGAATGTEPSAPAPPSTARKGRKPELAAATAPTAPGRYRDVGRDFELSFPETWHVLRSIDNDAVTCWVTPTAGVTNPDELEVCVQVSSMPVPDSSALQGKDAVSLLEHLLPLMKQWEPGLVHEGTIEECRLGALAGAVTTMNGKTRTSQQPVTIRAHVAAAGDLMFFVATQTLEGQGDAHRDALASILSGSTFGRAVPERRETSLEARRIVETYKNSVVSVVAESASGTSTGTGFIISDDGYLLTNHHVIWDSQTNKACDRFYVEWDESLRKRRAEARLVDYEFELGAYARFHGTDIALLKIEGGPYIPMPLTPLTGVQAGDNVVTLGFPSRDKLAGISLTITTGVVTRMNRGPDGKVVTIYTDAAITHGSSGGPCVSLVTGGVIGLNTFGTDVVLDRGAAHLNDLINYFGVVPIDHCLREFPLETDLRIPRDGSTLDWFDAYRLSRKYAEIGSPRVAARLAARVVALRPELAESHWLQALGRYVAGIELGQDEGVGALLKELPNIVAGFEDVLRMDPESSAALLMLSNIHLELGKLQEARAYAERATQASPEDWQAQLMRGRVALSEKQLGLAIQCSARAKELSANALPEPFVLAGNAHYANKAYDAGRTEFQSAVRLHPASLDARMGIASYHDLQGHTEEAVGEYRRVLEDFPRNPLVLAAIGKAYYTAKRYPDASREYDVALQRFEEIGQTPPAEMLYCMADALLQQKESAGAAHVFSQFLSYYPNGEVAAKVHIQVAPIWLGAERHGLAAAHIRAAKALTADPKLKAELDGMQLQPLSLEEIELLLKLRYPLDVAHLLIRLSPLTFAIESEEDVKRLHGELGIPGPLIEAIIASNKEFGVQPGGGAQSVVGTWSTQGQLQDGTRYRVVAEYTKDRFKADTFANGQLISSITGVYKVENGVIVARSDQGVQERYPFEFRGAQIFVQMPGVGTVAFDRVK
jgi:S1-C subfamily serine protease/tetratricopeptide (TPR) repeat protein